MIEESRMRKQSQQGDGVKREEYALRAMTDDGAFRVITLRSTETVRAIVKLQKSKGFAASTLGDLVTGTILVRETMAPNYRVQGIVGDAKGEMLLAADSFPDGGSRGLMRLPAKTKDLCWEQVRRLQIMRTLANGETQQGLVEVSTENDMSQSFMHYMTYSEQVATVLAVGCVMRDQSVLVAGGYLLQLLPEVEKEALGEMIARLENFAAIDDMLLETKADPADLMNRVLRDIPYTELERSAVFFNCNCSEKRVLGGLATLAHKEIESLAKSDRTIEIDCDFCAKQYRISPHQLRGLLVAT